MGLDMYLTATHYLGCWSFTDEAEKSRFRQIMQLAEFGDFCCKDAPGLEVEVNVAYWRKANAIHRWFVDNVQGGDDSCKKTYVSNEHLAALVSLCKQVLDSVETVPGQLHAGTTYYPDGRVVENFEPGNVVAQQWIAASTLPTQSGFFFGNTDYNEWYLDSLRKTVEQIEPLLTDPRFQHSDFYYRASW